MENNQVGNEKGQVVCGRCGSANLIRRGYRENKHNKVQRFGCKDCNHRFIMETDGFRKMVYRPDTITLVLDLYFKGLSLRKIVDHLKQFHNLKISHTTVLRWIQKYVEIMHKYVDEFKPQVSNTWHADEMAINVDGTYRWLWNLLDGDTRFLLATQITEQREVEDAQRLFTKAKEKAGKRPETIVTDGLQSYRGAYSTVFRTMKEPRTEHIRLTKLGDKSEQNLIERFHGTTRERNKVMRGLDTDGSTQTFVQGFQIYYNYIRKHMGLENRTPAEVAGIDLELGENRWLSLIRQATKSQTTSSIDIA